jgi:serine/threonine protein kinase
VSRESPPPVRDANIPDQIGGYRVLSQISSGGMGRVVLASKHGSHGFEKRVAIKLILPHLAVQDDYRTLFFREARIAALRSFWIP